MLYSVSFVLSNFVSILVIKNTLMNNIKSAKTQALSLGSDLKIMTTLKTSTITKTLLPVILAGTGIITVSSNAEAVTFQVTENVYGTAADVGTLAWAIDQSNTTAGFDIINIMPDLQIDVNNASPISPDRFLARITDSVNIQGNGAKLVGNPNFVTETGQLATKTNIIGNPYEPAISFDAGDLLLAASFNFAQIGTPNSNNDDLNVFISDLGADGLTTFAQTQAGSQLIMNGGDLTNMVNYLINNDTAGRPVFEATPSSTLDLNDISITNSYPFANVLDASPDYSIFFGVIQGEDSVLKLKNSSINNSFGAGAINWNGGTANVVSSIIEDAGGLSIADGELLQGTLNLVNSIVYMTGGDNLSQTQRIQAAVGGEANIIASSVLYDTSNTSEVGCDVVAYQCNGMPLTATNGGVLNFNSSVALPLNPQLFFPGKNSYSEFSSGNLIADQFSYIAATPTQDGNAVKALFDNANILTEGNTYDLLSGNGLSFFKLLPGGAVPLTDGVLVSVIPDATPGGVNQLINPIDGSPITTDVFGNPRTNGAGFRDIGAVQVQVPEQVPEPSSLAGFVIVSLMVMGFVKRQENI